MIQVGQRLWWVDHSTNTEGTVIVQSTEESQFSVLYNGKIYYRPYSVLGEKLFESSQLRKSTPVSKANGCEKCFLRTSGECTRLSNVVCEDYRPTQSIEKSEQDSWPSHGDATSFRMQRRKPIKKEKW